jgi:uncharacterized protein YukE
MKVVIGILTLLFVANVYASAQDVRFTKDSDLIKVSRGTSVRIDVDTAYVIGKIKAEFINQKIKELNEIKVIYNDLAENHNKLLDEINSVQNLLEDLQEHIVKDSVTISDNFKKLIKELETSLNEFKVNNEKLKANNAELKSQIEQLEKIVKQLKKETRGIWWNGLTDKIVVFAGGVGVGMLLISILE